MRNPVISTAHFGPVYARKINVYYKRPGGLNYAWSTNAYKTCRDAAAAAKAKAPNLDFRAYFAQA